MLGYLFGLNARLGRLQYFLASIGLAIAMTALCFVFAGQIYQRVRYGMPPSFAELGLPVLALAGLYAVTMFMLICMRIRDIGWDPVVVVAGWFAFTIIDGLIASKVPAWSIGTDHHGTVVAGFVNVCMELALLFWPSGHAADEPPPQPRSNAPRRSNAPTAPTSRIARVANGEFGGRAR